MDILYLTPTRFPEKGMATANRIRMICKGLAEHGHHICIVAPFSDSGEKEILHIDGVEIRSLFNIGGKLGNIIKTRFLYFCSVFKYIVCNNKPDIVIAYSYSVEFLLLIWMSTRLFGIKYIREMTEYPLFMRLPDRFTWFGLRTVLEKYVVPKLFDGMILMTKNLEDWFASRVRSKCRIVRVPMTVDVDRFAKVDSKATLPFAYIAYMGSLHDKKDGIETLLRAFEKFSPKYPNVHLVRIGRAQESDEELKRTLESAEIRKRIYCTGPVTGAEIPNLLKYALALAIIRPDNIYARGGFPTKLGEYLASGTPVVTTPVGEIPVFLKDRENCYFADIGNVDSVVCCFEKIMKDPKSAIAIGKAGFMTARNEFHYENMSSKLSKWIEAF